jgi:ABC-type multidrug transport system ATPase subunit
MHEAARLCDRVAIIHRGRILAQGTPAELAFGHEDLEEAFAAMVAEVNA